MRIAHITDVHWTAPVPWSRLPGKRILGTANQILRGRRHHFPRAIQKALIEHLLQLAPDLVIFTGDLTAQALPEEFAMAAEDLEPLRAVIPVVMTPGNHDLYTQGAARDDRIAGHFEDLLYRTSGGIGHYTRPGLQVFTLDPNRPTGLHASGEVPSKQLEALARLIDEPAFSEDFRILALHYPVVDRHGAIYDGAHHGLLNARELLDLLRGCQNKPHLLIHGHEHHGYRVTIDLDGWPMVSIDCGSSGYAFMPEKRRAAAMAVYTVEEQSFTTERFLYDGTAFSPEPGGTFASGR